MVNDDVTPALATAAGLALLRAMDALLPSWTKLREELGVEEAGRDPGLLARVTALWPAFDMAHLTRESIRMQSYELCRTCGGWCAQPLWAQATFQSGLTAELYASPGAHTAVSCLSCSPTAPPALSLAELEQAATCTICDGLGLVPNWLFNFVSMPCMAAGQSGSAGLWFAVPCGGCGGWGKQRPRVDAEQQQDLTHTSSPDSKRDDQGDFLSFDGDRWSFQFDGRSIPMRDTVGMRHLNRLIAAAGRSISCIELCAAERPPEPTTTYLIPDEGLSISTGTGDSGQMIDLQAMRSYKSKLADLGEELLLAEENNDRGRVELLRHEREFIEAELVRSTSRRGAPRKVPADADRARKSVSIAIHRVLRHIGKQDAGLGAYLVATLTLGGECVFTPGDTTN